MRLLGLTIAALALGACSVSTDEEDNSLTVDVDGDRVNEIGEDVETIATDVGQDIRQGAQEATDRAEAAIDGEAREAEAEMEAEAREEDTAQ